MNPRCAFFVTTAIGNDYGIFSTEEKYQQLLETISSIKTYAPNSDIYLIDMTDTKLSEKYTNSLTSLTYKAVFLHDDPFILYVKSNEVTSTKNDSNLFHKKVLGELHGTILATQLISESDKKYDIVFKLTGRCTLNENFNVENFLHDAIVTKQWKKDRFFDRRVVLTRLWSFPYEKIQAVNQLFKMIYDETMRLMIEENKLQIIEESVYNAFKKYNVPHVELPVVGLNVIFAFDGTKIEE